VFIFVKRKASMAAPDIAIVLESVTSDAGGNVDSGSWDACEVSIKPVLSPPIHWGVKKNSEKCGSRSELSLTR
jgi:hypothetical protein